MCREMILGGISKLEKRIDQDEPTAGIEPATHALRMRCSTI